MELLTFTIAANETKAFAKAGRFVEIIAADWPLSLYLYDAAGSMVDEAKNALSGLFVEESFGGFQVANGPNAQTVTLLVHDGRGGSRRSPGVVQVIDGGRSRSMANQSGVANVLAAAVVGQFTYAQLWNPADSGLRLIVKTIYIGSSVAGDVFVRTHSAALATLQGTPVSKLNQNLLSGTELRNGQDPGLIGQGFLRIYAQANQAVIVRLDEPAVIEPGFGIMGTGGVVNRDCIVTFDFYRESIT